MLLINFITLAIGLACLVLASLQAYRVAGSGLLRMVGRTVVAQVLLAGSIAMFFLAFWVPSDGSTEIRDGWELLLVLPVIVCLAAAAGAIRHKASRADGPNQEAIKAG